MYMSVVYLYVMQCMLTEYKYIRTPTEHKLPCFVFQTVKKYYLREIFEVRHNNFIKYD